MQLGADIELVSTIRQLLDHPRDRDAMACAGHERVLREHTYERRLKELLDAAGVSLKSAARVTPSWIRFESLARQHRPGPFLLGLRAMMVVLGSLVWGRARGARAARRALFEFSWRLAGRRTYTAAGLPGRLFYRES